MEKASHVQAKKKHWLGLRFLLQNYPTPKENSKQTLRDSGERARASARQTSRQIPDMAMTTELGTQEDNLHQDLNKKV